MRTLNPSLALASLVGFLAAASCTLITDVDRTKIPTDAGAEGGSPGTGGTGGTGGTTETGGTGGTGTGGEAGQGTGGSTGGGAGMGQPTPVCTQATGSLTIKPMTYFADGDTFTLNDGVNAAVVFEFDLDTSEGVRSGNVAVPFTATDNQFQVATTIVRIIKQEHTDGKLRIQAVNSTTSTAATSDGEAGASGSAGTPGEGTAGQGGQGGMNLDESALIHLTNDLAGARGNQKIKDTVGNPGFVPAGMSGGEAVACGSPASCTSDEECSTSCGDDHICVQ
jgi:hypothetical protein